MEGGEREESKENKRERTMGAAHLVDTMGDGLKVFSKEVAQVRKRDVPKFMQNLTEQNKICAGLKVLDASNHLQI